MTHIVDVVALMAVALLFGSIAFFSFFVAPIAFTTLDIAMAGRFVRGMFPWYYLELIVLSAIATLALGGSHAIPAALMGATLLGALLSRQILMPRINQCSDRIAGGDKSAKRSFDRLHQTSVAINGVQLILAIVVLVQIGIGLGPF